MVAFAARRTTAWRRGAPAERTLYMAMLRGIAARLLGVWLILHGLFALIGLTFHYQPQVMGLLALVAGVLVLAGR
jgi:hypothetical protein